MMLRQDKWLATGVERRDISIENRPASSRPGKMKMVAINGQMGAGGQAHQVDCVGQAADLVEIIHTPDQAALAVAPGSEIFHVQISHAEQLRSVHQACADARKKLRPAIKRSAKKTERTLRHQTVLESQIAADERHLLSQPCFIFLGRQVNSHFRFSKVCRNSTTYYRSVWRT